jgi:hypothetical protein
LVEQDLGSAVSSGSRNVSVLPEPVGLDKIKSLGSSEYGAVNVGRSVGRVWDCRGRRVDW